MNVRNEWQQTGAVYAEEPWWSPVEFFLNEDRTKIVMPKLSQIANVDQPWLYISAGAIIFNPLFWNIVARNEYRNKTLTKTFGSAQRATYFLAATIFGLGIVRDSIFKKALETQPTAVSLGLPEIKLAAIALFAAGQILVISSTWALGINGTYLADYMGILQPAKVTGFPFSLLENPMYDGSTMCFVATSLYYGKPAGLVLSLLVYIVYQIALAYEGPFTNMIYSSRGKKTDGVTKRTAAPSTPQKSNKTNNNDNNSSSTPQSYAAAAAPDHKSADGLPSTDPAPIMNLRPRASVDDVTASPMRVTRSRAKAQNIDSD